MRVLPKNTTVYAWINGKLERAYAEYIPAQGYNLEGKGVFQRSSLFLTKQDAIETEMKKVFDRLIELETMKRTLE